MLSRLLCILAVLPVLVDAINLCDALQNWSSWSSCSKTCGGGFKTRHCRYDAGATQRERCNPVCYNNGEFYAGACHCVPGTHGDCCMDIKECASNPCKNGGTCVEQINQYTCNCPTGTIQPNCEDILECASNPCQNGGTCHEHINGYTCDCVLGTTGPNCDDILECASNPCQNGGTCHEHINGYTCDCVLGTTGPNCDDILECASDPCQNGGTCIEMINKYDCTCLREFTGDNCEKDLFSRHDITCQTGTHHSCYIVFRLKDTWQGAKDFCSARNGHLAVPDDMDEELFLENYMESIRVRFPEHVFWIGGTKSGTNSPQWVSGHKHNLDRWPTGVSENIAGTQCMAMDGAYNFEWQTFPCDRQLFYVCEEIVPFSIVG